MRPMIRLSVTIHLDVALIVRALVLLYAVSKL